MIDAGSGRLTGISAVANTVGVGGGDQYMQQHTHGSSVSVTDNGHAHSVNLPWTLNNPYSGGAGPFSTVVQVTPGGGQPQPNTLFVPSGTNQGTSFGAFTNTTNIGVGVTVGNINGTITAGSGNNLQPTVVAGITMIRAG
jgi:hypothetical protein